MSDHLIQPYVIQSYYCSRDVLTEVALMLQTTVSISPPGVFPSLFLMYIYIVHSSSTRMQTTCPQRFEDVSKSGFGKHVYDHIVQTLFN